MKSFKVLITSIILFPTLIFAQNSKIKSKHMIGDWKFDYLILSDDKKTNQEMLESIFKTTHFNFKKDSTYFNLFGFDDQALWEIEKNKVIISTKKEKIKMDIKSKSPDSLHILLDVNNQEPIEMVLLNELSDRFKTKNKLAEDNLNNKSRQLKAIFNNTIPVNLKLLKNKWTLSKIEFLGEKDPMEVMMLKAKEGSEYDFSKSENLKITFWKKEYNSTYSITKDNSILINEKDEVKSYKLGQLDSLNCILIDTQSKVFYYLKSK